MKQIMRVMCVVLVILSIATIFFPQVTSAADWSYTSALDSTWANKSTEEDTGVVGATRNVMGVIVNVIRIVATGVAIIMITYVAIKYMSAAPEEKADFKKSAMAFIVGAVVLFASSGILSVIGNFAASNIK